MNELTRLWLAWLRKDARNRAIRTFLQTIAASAIVGGLDAAQSALAAGRLDGAAILHSALSAGITAATAGVLAYLHRVKLDPSIVPSINPPDGFGVNQ